MQEAGVEAGPKTRRPEASPPFAMALPIIAHYRDAAVRRSPMPSLSRFLLVLILLGLAGFGLVYALGTYVKPATRPMSQDVPLKNLEPAKETAKP